VNADLIPFAQLCPGERFLTIGTPHVVKVKTSHTWCHWSWKGKCHEQPLHWTTLVRHAPAGQLNPGEQRA
jgi:hypothetical protein